MNNIIMLTVALLFVVGNATAQEPDWLLRIPQYYRLKGGSCTFVVDKMRNAIMFDGGAYDTYVTYDSSTTWQPIFDIKMFYLDVSTRWNMDEVGRWYYTGNVYGKKTINLVTEDAGQTIRYLIVDTNHLPFVDRWEGTPKIRQPNIILFDVSRAEYVSDSMVKKGTYSSCDAGVSWRYLPKPSSWVSSRDFSNVEPGTLLLSGENGAAVEYSPCSGMVANPNLKAHHGYLRLSDGTVIQKKDVGFRVERSDDSLISEFTTYPFTGKDSLAPFYIQDFTHINDTLALLIGRRGVLATYGVTSGLRFLDIPPHESYYQQTVDVGRLGDRVLLHTYIPGRSERGKDRWILCNTRDGSATVHEQLGPTSFYGLRWNNNDGLFSTHRILPVTDSTWLASFSFAELMKTTNAGRSWQYVDNIQRDMRWGEKWFGISRLFPRGDGSMMVSTEKGRIMVRNRTSREWVITHPSPFVHEIKLNPNATQSITRTNVLFGEDDDSRYRIRFGPSSIYFANKDEYWTSGDVVCRYSTTQGIIDTVLPRRARLIKRISPGVIVAAMDSVYFSMNNGAEWVYVGYMWPYNVRGKDTLRSALGDMVVAKNGDIIAGLRGIQVLDTLGEFVDSMPGGVIVSRDNGNTWFQHSEGLPTSLYVSSLHVLDSGAIVAFCSEVRVDPTVVDFGGNTRAPLDIHNKDLVKLDQSYIYRSDDNGATWLQVFTFPDREFLAEQDMRFLPMPDGRIMAMHPSAGIAISSNQGRNWVTGDPLNIGDPQIYDVAFTSDGYAHLATSHGYARMLIDNIVHVSETRTLTGTVPTIVGRDGILRINSEDLPTTVSLLTLDGRTLTTATEQTGIRVLDVSNLSRGVYLVVATYASGIRTALVAL